MSLTSAYWPLPCPSGGQSLVTLMLLTLLADRVMLVQTQYRPRTCDRAMMSRFTVVHRIAPRAVLAGQVDCPVRLVASRLAGCAWWNDCETARGSVMIRAVSRWQRA